MSSSAPSAVSISQAQDLQRQLESTVLKMEKAGLLQDKAGDHIRVIVAEGIADHFGDRYRVYPLVPRPNNLPIRRNAPPGPCVLAIPAKMKNIKKKVAEPVPAETNVSSSAKTVTTTTSRGATRRVSAWAAGVANASPASTSPEKSVVYEARLAGSASRWDAILDQPIQLSVHPLRGSYTLSGWKTEKRAVSPGLTEDVSTTNLPATAKIAMVDGTADMPKVEDSDFDAFFDKYARASSPKNPVTPCPEPATVPKTADNADNDDWLIDLSS